MTYDRRCLAIARDFLRDYELSREERDQEAEALAQVIQTAVELQLENLEHRRKA